MIAGRPRHNVRTVPARAAGKAQKPMAGDNLVYVLEGNSAAMLPDDGDIFGNPFVNFTEWDSEEDEKGFANF